MSVATFLLTVEAKIIGLCAGVSNRTSMCCLSVVFVPFCSSEWKSSEHAFDHRSFSLLGLREAASLILFLLFNRLTMFFFFFLLLLLFSVCSSPVGCFCLWTQVTAVQTSSSVTPMKSCLWFPWAGLKCWDTSICHSPCFPRCSWIHTFY